MAGWEALQDVGAFDFGGVIVEVDSLFDGGGLGGEPGTPERQTAYDLTMLGAAGIHVAGIEQTDERPSPGLYVHSSEARIAFLKFACARTIVHRPRAFEELQMPDVVPFSGDIAKLGAVGATSAYELATNFDGYFEALLGLYRESPSPLTRAVADRGWLHLEGLIWRTTLWAIASPSQVPAVVDGHLARYSEYLGYLDRGLPAG